MIQMSMTSLRVNCSALAGLVGRTSFATPSDSVLTVWKSSDPQGYAEAHRRCGVETPEQRKRRIREYYPGMDAIARTTKPSLLSTSRLLDAESEWRGTSRFLPDGDLGDRGDRGDRGISSQAPSAEEALRLAKETAYTQHGIDRESSVLRTVDRVLDRGFEPVDALFSTEVGRTRSGTPVVLQGRVDAMSGDGTTVLEIKTRARGLFMTLKEYERVQISAYMYLTGARDAVLAEAYFSSRAAPDPDVNIVPVPRDDAYIDDLIRETVDRAEAVDRLVRDRAFQDAFVRSSRRDGLIKSVWTDCCSRSGDVSP